MSQNPANNFNIPLLPRTGGERHTELTIMNTKDKSIDLFQPSNQLKVHQGQNIFNSITLNNGPEKDHYTDNPAFQIFKIDLTRTHTAAQKKEIRPNIWISNDNKTAFIAIWRNIISVDLETKEILQNTIIRHDDDEPIEHITLKKQESKLISCSNNGKIQIWNNINDKNFRPKPSTQIQNISKIRSFVLSPDSKILAIISEVGSIKLWSLDLNSNIGNLGDETSRLNRCVAFTPNMKFLISGDDDNNIWIWDLKTLKAVHRFRHAHLGPVLCLKVSQDGNTLYSGSSDRSVSIWDLVDKKLLNKFSNVHSSEITSLELTDDGQFILALSNSQTVSMLCTIAEVSLGQIRCGVDGTKLVGVDITKDYRRIATVDDEGNVFIIERRTNQNRWRKFFPINEGPERRLRLSHDEKYMVSINNKSTVSFFNLNAASSITVEGELQGITEIHDRDFRRVDGSGGIYISRSLQDTDASQERLVAYEFSFDNKYFLKTCEDLSVHLYDFEEMTHQSSIIPSRDKFGLSVLQATKFTKSGKYFILISTDRYSMQRAHIWDGKSFKERAVHCLFDRPTGEISCLTTISRQSSEFSLEDTIDTHFVTGSRDKSITVWNMEDVNNVRIIRKFNDAHESEIHSLRTTHDNRVIISVGYEDYTIKLWDYNTGMNIYEFKSSNLLPPRHFFVSKDDNYIYSGDDSGSYFEVFNLKNKEKVLFCSPSYELKERSKPISSSPTLDKIVCSYRKRIYIVEAPFNRNDILYSYKCQPDSIFSSLPLESYDTNENSKVKERIIKAFPGLVLNNYGQNWFHKVAKEDSNKQLIRTCLESEIPFTLDFNDKTPLHYLFEKKYLDVSSIKLILASFEAILERSQSPCNLLSSLSSIIPKIIELNSPQVVTFLDLCMRKPEPEWGLEIARHGKIKNEDLPFTESRSLNYSKEVEEDLLTDVIDSNLKRQKIDLADSDTINQKLPKVSIRVLPFAWDYGRSSEDMIELVERLSKVTNQDIYKTDAVSLFISYLWQGIQNFYIMLAALFSLQVILLSIYTGTGSSNDLVEATVLFIALFFILYETIEMKSEGFKSYISSVWNYFDIPGNILIAYTIISGWLSDEEKETRAWLFSMCLAFIYLRWISYFKIIKQTRSLVRFIVEIIRDTRSFVAILTCIILGSSIIFLQFDRTTPYSVHLLNSYSLLFSNFDLNTIENSGMMFFEVIVVALVCIVLLNLLIAIMGGTYSRLQDCSVLLDSQALLALIDEYSKINKALDWIRIKLNRPMQKKGARRFLFYVEDKTKEEMSEEDKESSRQDLLTSLINDNFVGLKKDILEMKTQIKALNEAMQDTPKHASIRQESSHNDYIILKQELVEMRHQMNALAGVQNKILDDPRVFNP